MWINWSLCKLITSLEYLVIKNSDTWTIRNKICLWLTCLIVCYDNLSLLLVVTELYLSAKLCNDRKSLWLSGLEKLLNSWKTLCDIATGNTTGMECTHGQLCTRFTDWLSCDNTNSFTNLDRLTCCHVRTITFRADTDVWFTRKNRTNLHFCNRSTVFVHTKFHYLFCTFWCYHMVCFYDDISIFIINCLTYITSCDTFL